MAPIMVRIGFERRSTFRRLVLAAPLLAVVGCGGTPDQADLASASSAIVGENALSMNALSMNALSMNALSMNALSMNALSMNALSMNALSMNGLRDPLARELLTYIVSCALDDDQDIKLTIDGTKYDFAGSLGLAPQWGKKNGSCDGSCQRWVSACVLARVDAAGVHRPISMRGLNPALRPDPGELTGFTDREAAYYGNIFIPGAPKYLCLSPGKTSDTRVCGDSLASCPMTVEGSCDHACAFEGPYGAFSVCSDTGTFPARGQGRLYPESITVYLPKSAM